MTPAIVASPGSVIIVARRKEIYEALHPETKHGIAGSNARWKNGKDAVANSATASVERFTSATAKATGKAERTIRLAVARGGRRSVAIRVGLIAIP